MGTVAPTGRFTPIVWGAVSGYVAGGIALIVFSAFLAPWGLLLLIPAVALFGAAGVLAILAVGINVIEADEA
ncbi:MAG: hypothetical protein P0Y60_14665 [Candidatus Microbacterium colombiense]|nr:MAG: hypothetical protein P0Y60_14665 [Microbacterium sp.]